ncbi:MAG: lectin-like protein [Bacteroidota bacterium]
MLSIVMANISYAQTALPKDVKEKLLQAYKKIRTPEISFEKFAEINSQVYSTQTQNRTQAQANAATAAAALAVQDPYCSKVRAYCTNGDFESGLDQNQYTGAYGFWYAGLYPDPFSLSYGFSSGILTNANAHQTIVTKASGNDPATGLPLVAANGGTQSLRLGNAINGNGTEIIAKTIVVDPNESILNFYYSLVLQDPGHAHDDQPAFSVRAYDCATGLELPNVCNLGNGSNIAVADAGDPFFQSKTYAGELLVYRDWSLAQINLSPYIGKTVILVFTTKDCNLGGHFGYAYLDNLFSGQCPAVGITTNQGSIKLDPTPRDSCGDGLICVKYSLPYLVSNNVITYGDITISVNIYQNNTLVKTVSSPPKLTFQPVDSTYCFGLALSLLGLDNSLGGFDYTITGAFSVNGFSLPAIIIGNPPTGQKAGINNDYNIVCTTGCHLTTGNTTKNETDNNANGEVNFSPAGGTAPYVFLLNGVTNSTGIFTGLVASSYPYSITDSKNCTTTGTLVIGRTVTSVVPTGCPADIIVTANAPGCSTVINWAIPSMAYPDTIPITPEFGLTNGTLKLKGTYNGHGYYQSDLVYSWPAAKLASSQVNGHLVTITDVGEDAFIKTNLPQPDYGAWIGLYNTGTVGSFAWVTGEPVNYTDWNIGEPNNEGGNATTVAEPYVHIRSAAPNDKWNDISPEWKLPAVVEYDNPILTYTQTSGPAPGSTVTPGVYTICYDIKNNATGITSTCCFKITVVCSGTSSACPGDTTIATNNTDCLVNVAWDLPSMKYPDAISIAGGTTLATGTLKLRGEYGGHGYYQSDDQYSWPDAKAAAANVTGHLVTITDAGEDNFIKAQLPQPDFGAWIGLHSNGFTGGFEWVNGEPFSFADWNLGEPNNEGQPANAITGEYVHIRGAAPNDRWNDLSFLFNLQFIAEFDNPVLTYTQVSGIPYGSAQGAGVYPICYEITNTITGEKTTCCFKVTVVCNAASARTINTGINNKVATAQNNNNLTAQSFGAMVFPNPSHANNAFSLKTQSNNLDEKVSIKVFDVMGRTIETKISVQPNGIITLGNNYRPGMYFIQVIQGKKTVTLRLMKQ